MGDKYEVDNKLIIAMLFDLLMFLAFQDYSIINITC
jgi:hypothetical protein